MLSRVVMDPLRSPDGPGRRRATPEEVAGRSAVHDDRPALERDERLDGLAAVLVGHTDDGDFAHVARPRARTPVVEILGQVVRRALSSASAEE